MMSILVIQNRSAQIVAKLLIFSKVYYFYYYNDFFQGENLLPDGEVLHATYEIFKELPVFNNENVVIHLNHTLLLKGIMLHLGIREQIHYKILEIFSNYEVNLIIVHY